MATLSTVTARAALKIQREPHWEKVSEGNYLGFRRMTTTSAQWLARSRNTETGKQRFKTLGDLSAMPPSEQWRAAKEEAQVWFKHLGQGGNVESITVLVACRRYVDHLASEGHVVASKDYARRYTDYVEPYKKFSSTPITKLTKAAVQAWRKAHAETPCKTGSRIGQKRSSSALNREMATVKAALNLALADGFVTTDQAWKTALKPVEGATGQRDVYLDRGQREALIEHATPALKPFLQAACLLPLRPGALAQLTVGDFNQALGTLKISHDKTAGRTIGLPPDTVKFLKQQCLSKLPTAPMFTDGEGKPWNKDSWKHPLKAAALAAGLSKLTTMYALRHSTITDLAQSGVDLTTVGQLAGTSILMIQKHYGHLTAAQGATALQILTTR